MQILDADLDKLADPRPGEKQRFDHQSLPAVRSIGRLDQALDFDAIEAVDTAAASRGRGKGKLAPHLLDDVLGLIIAESMLAPQACCGADDRGEATLGWRLRLMTTHSASLWRARPTPDPPSCAQKCAGRAFYAQA